MAKMTITEKSAGSSTPAVGKILDTDINQIRDVAQTGLKDLYTGDIEMKGTRVRLNDTDVGIKFDTTGSKMQFTNDGSSWNDMGGGETGTTFEVTAGENLAIRDVVYMDKSDNKVYKCDQSDSNKQDWLGVMATAVNTDNTGNCNMNSAIVGGFTGLDEGEWYSVSSTAGGITQSEDNVVGIAISTTQLKLIKNTFLTKNPNSNIKEIYTDVGFNSAHSSSAGTGTDEQSHELTAITSSNILGKSFVKITITGQGYVASGNQTRVLIKSQIKEIGGSYSDITDYLYFLRTTSDGLTTVANSVVVIHQLTTGEKANGFQIQCFSSSYGGTGTASSFTNKQTILELL